MRVRTLALGAVVVLAGCVRAHSGPKVENDESIVFPNFFETAAVQVGGEGRTYELDGVTLRAVMIAANDLFPPGGKDLPCNERQEAHRYRVIRRGDVIFVQVDDDDVFCGLKYLSLDTGMRYAISVDGRILRRSPATEPGNPGVIDAGISASQDAQDAGVPASGTSPDAGRDADAGLVPRQSFSASMDGGT